MREQDSRRIDKQKLLAFGDRYRIYILGLMIFAFMSIFAPRFLTPFNLTTIMRTVAMNATIAVGFTIVMICGQLDLSIGRVATIAGVIGLSLQPSLGYALSVPVAILAGAAIGVVNGLLVTKAKIHSFIVTIGTMTVLQGVIYTATGGNSVSLSSRTAFAVSDFLAFAVVPLVTPRVLIAVVLIVVVEIVLAKTRLGRNFFLVGGNKNTAWLAGIKTDAVVTTAFALSGAMAAVGGVLFAMESSAATLNMGENSLMYVVSATIIGGTSMAGGKGGVFKTVVAVLSLELMYTGIVLFGFGNEVKIFIAGLILALVVLYEAYAIVKHERTVGRRPELLRELANRSATRP